MRYFSFSFVFDFSMVDLILLAEKMHDGYGMP